MKTIARLIVAFLTFVPIYALIPVDYAAAASVNCSCVLFLREVLGVDIHGNADTINANEPINQIEPGDVLLFSYAKEDHVAVITDVIQAHYPSRPEVYVTIQEANFHHCKEDTRTIPLSDAAIRGLYRPAFSTESKSLLFSAS